jgi:hypothetical protein
LCSPAVSLNPSDFVTHREFRKTAEYEGRRGRSDGKHWMCTLLGLNNKKELHHLGTNNKLRTNPHIETMMLKTSVSNKFTLLSCNSVKI